MWTRTNDAVRLVTESESYPWPSALSPPKTTCQEGCCEPPAVVVAKSKPATPAPKAKAVTASVVTLKVVFEQLGETHALPNKQTHNLLANFVAANPRTLLECARIRMNGLGILEVKPGAHRA